MNKTAVGFDIQLFGLRYVLCMQGEHDRRLPLLSHTEFSQVKTAEPSLLASHCAV